MEQLARNKGLSSPAYDFVEQICLQFRDKGFNLNILFEAAYHLYNELYLEKSIDLPNKVISKCLEMIVGGGGKFYDAKKATTILQVPYMAEELDKWTNGSAEEYAVGICVISKRLKVKFMGLKKCCDVLHVSCNPSIKELHFQIDSKVPQDLGMKIEALDSLFQSRKNSIRINMEQSKSSSTCYTTLTRQEIIQMHIKSPFGFAIMPSL